MKTTCTATYGRALPITTIALSLVMVLNLRAQDAPRSSPVKVTKTAVTSPLVPAAQVSGTGTANVVPKWTDGSGTLANSSIFDDGTNIGIGNASPGGVFDLTRSSSGDLLMRIWNQGSGAAKLRYVAATGATSQLQLTDGFEWLSAIAGNATGLEFRVRGAGTTNSEAQLNSSARMTIDRTGNVTFTGDVNVSGNIAAKYQDVAEWVPSATQLPPGTVLVLNPEENNQVMQSRSPYDTRVAGVVSAAPGVILGEKGDSKLMVATSGRVTVLVDAEKHPIHVGDLLVTGEKPGTAMLSVPVDVGGVTIHRPGTIVGKALEPLAAGQKKILVLLTLQ